MCDFVIHLLLQATLVTNQQVIDAYLRLRSEKDATFLKHYVAIEDKSRSTAEKMAARKQQRQQARQNVRAIAQARTPSSSAQKRSESSSYIASKNKCSTCGKIGHTKNNRLCPRYDETHPAGSDGRSTAASRSMSQQITPPEHRQSASSAVTPVQPAASTSQPIARGVTMIGTKIRLSRAMVEIAERAKKRAALTLRLPKHIMASGQQQSSSMGNNAGGQQPSTGGAQTAQGAPLKMKIGLPPNALQKAQWHFAKRKQYEMG